jgi:hypothetical protein
MMAMTIPFFSESRTSTVPVRPESFAITQESLVEGHFQGFLKRKEYLRLGLIGFTRNKTFFHHTPILFFLKL